MPTLPERLSSNLKHIKLLSIALLTYLGAQQLMYEMELDDYLYALWNEATTKEETKKRSIWLPNYTLTQETRLPFVSNNLSGITYNPDSGHLWVIINSPQRLIELDTEFNHIRTIELKNFTDTEAVAYAGNNRLAIADERDQSVVIANIDGMATEVLDKQALPRLTLDTNGGGNKGFEGIAVDASAGTIYAVRERDPMTLLSITGLLDNDIGVTVRTDNLIDAKDLYLSDLSGLHFDTSSGNLLFLSDESKALGEVDLQGNRVSYLDLVKGFHGLQRDIPQPEGVTMGPRRSIFVVSEPNIAYRFDLAGS